MDTGRSFETSIIIYQSTRRNIHQDLIFVIGLDSGHTDAQKRGLAGVLCGVGRKAVPRQEEGAPLLHLLAYAAARSGAISAVL
jgi:hypothetical protein